MRHIRSCPFGAAAAVHGIFYLSRTSKCITESCVPPLELGEKVMVRGSLWEIKTELRWRKETRRGFGVF
jgi:hypothetical protein